jgi:hypothetical protein
MSTTKQRIRAAFARGKSGAAGIRPTAIAAIAGAAVGVVDNKLQTGGSYPQFVTDHPYVKPAAVALVAFLAGRRMPSLGLGLAGAAGMMGAQVYLNSTSTTPGTTTQGFGYTPEAGAFGPAPQAGSVYPGMYPSYAVR